MKYQAYPEYKDSGIEWLEDIPAQWKLCRLKFMAQIKNGQDYKHVEANEGFPVIGSGGQFTYATEYMFDKESVLLGRKGTIDKPLFIDEPFWSVDTMYYTDIGEGIPAKYLYYLALTIQFNRYSTNTALPSMTQERLGNYIFTIPNDKFEKQNIANFLDHETAKIDTLIEKQQQLIKLLKEKRQAVISHAVTKGLNPDVPMRDSGVEWLGEVPEHWERITFKYLLKKMVDNRGRTPPTYDTGIPLLEAKHIDGSIKYSSDEFDKFIDEEGHKNFIRDDVSKNDILFITVGTIGKTCLVPSSSNFVIAQNIVGLRVLDSCSPLFLLFWLRSMVARESMLATNKDSILDSIKISDFVQSRLYIPPICEQEKIAEFLDNKIIRIDDLIKKAGEVIDLMRERRTALISAAVTGKIDVRCQ